MQLSCLSLITLKFIKRNCAFIVGIIRSRLTGCEVIHTADADRNNGITRKFLANIRNTNAYLAQVSRTRHQSGIHPYLSQEAKFTRLDDRLSAAAHIQFAIDAGGVCFDRTQGDNQISSNFGI